MKDGVILLLCAFALAQGLDIRGNQNVRTCNCDPSEAQQICQANYGNDNVLIAHANCDKFYKCSNGKPVAYNCPADLMYNPFTEECDWPDNVDCGDRPISDGTESDDADCDDDSVGGGDNDSDDNINDGTCNCNPGEAPSICAADGSNGILVAHENCNQFYKCAEGKPVVFDCPPTLLYNPYTEQCDWPNNVDCEDRVIPEPDADAGGGSSNEDNGGTDNDNNGTCNCNPEEAPTICAASGSDGVLVAHENCNQFYQCDHGKPVVFTCPGTLLYNPHKEQCDWPQNVDCGDRFVPETEEGGCSICNDGNDSADIDEVPPPGDDPGNDSSDVDDIPPGGDDPGNDSNDIDDIPPGGDDPGNDNDSNDNGGICNCNPEEAPSICAVDDSDGVLIAHENCNQFYKCDHGKPVAFTCPENLLYNPYTEKCDWPDKVDCGDRVIPEDDSNGDAADNDSNGDNNDNDNGDNNDNVGAGNCDPSEAPAICAADDSEGILVAHENCNQFYMCSGGKPVALKCPGNTLFNPNIDQCDWPENVDCGDRVIPSPEDDSDDTGNDSDDIDDLPPGGDDTGNDNNGNDNDGTCNCNPEEASSICAGADSSGVLIAHENCNQFYKCDHGKPVVITCPGKLLYNPYTEQCDWPENVDCGDRVIPDLEDDSNGDTDNSNSNEDGNDNGNDDSNDNVGAGNCDPSEAPAICGADDSDGILVAHENCNQFYICSGGKPVALKCPGNTLFNPNIDQCDWPENVDCGDRVIPGPEDDDTGNDSDDIDDLPPGGDDAGNDNNGNDNDGTCNCNPEEASTICAGVDSSGVLIAHENCNQFYKCDHGKPVAMTCPGNLLYNPYKEQCDWPENVDCGDRVIPDLEDDSNGDTDNSNSNEDGNDNGNDDSNDNVGAGNCDPSEAPAICGADDSDGILVAHENCNQFYICSGGKPVALKCPGNTLFNPNIDQCDWPENVDCGDRVIPGPEDDDTGNDSDDIDDLPPGGDDAGNDNNGNDNDGTCNCNPEEASTICAGVDSSGVLIAHENCNQFYKCDHGKPVAMTCPGNLLYNPYKEQCDWPENVDCGDRVIPDLEDDSNGDTDNSNSNEDGNDNGNDDSNDNVGAGNCDPSEAPAICGADDSDGILVAHENCNQFYICSGGKPVALKCPGNTLFNPNIDQCDWPDNVDCGDRVIPDPDDDSSSNDNDGGGNDNLPPGGDDAGNDNNGNDNDGTCNCNPEEASTICAGVDSSGVLVAHENCNQFYKCDHGKPVAMTCPGNLLYNPHTEQCDWPERVDCGDRVIPDLEDDSNDIGNDSGDIDDIPPGGDDPGNDSGSIDDLPPGGDDAGNDNDGTCNCNPEEAPAICEIDGSDGVLIAHENCNQFYKCDHGKPVAMTCPGNLLYNPLKEQCDWPENVDCGDRVIPDLEDDSNGDTDNSNSNEDGNDNGNDDSNDNVGAGNCDPSEAPTICAADGSDGILVAHENCNQFYMCSGGKPVALKCPGNTLFNPDIDQCDWPENVDCGDRVIPDPEDDSDDTGNDSHDIDDLPPGGDDAGNDNDGTCNCNPEEAPAICSIDGSDGVLIAHENCNQFYKCDHGKPVAMTCPGNLLYNPHNEQCDWPERVDCGDRVIPDPEDNDTDDGSDNDNDGGDSAGNDNDGNDNNGTCNCNPEEAPAICSIDGSDGVLIAHENCNQFYKCDHGKPVAMTCPGNLLYNPHNEQCDWPERVDCGDRVIPEPDEDNDDTSKDIDDNLGNDSDGNVNEPDDNIDNDSDCDDDNDNEGTCNCKPDEAPSICAVDGSDGVLIAHENCNQFYKCDNGKPVAFTCPSKLLYNPITEECDWADRVDCGDRVIPDPEDDNNNDNDANDSNEVDSENDNGSTCNCKPEEAPAICAVDGSSGVLVAHENCNQFYKCDNGKPVALSCPGILLYDPLQEQCDWPERVDCGDRVIPESGEDNDDIDDIPGNDTNDSNNNDINDDPSQAPTICAESESDGVLVAHENCNQFYMCSGGSPVALSCSGELLFNPIIQQCDWPRNVDCGDRIVPGGDNDDVCACNFRNAPVLCSRENSNGVLVAHENCNQFYVCVDRIPVARDCAANLYYNPDKEVCDWPQNVNCGNRLLSYASLNKHLESRQILRK